MSKTLLVCVSLVTFGFLSTLFPARAEAAVELSSNSLSFGSVAVNTASSPATISITNAGRQTVTIGEITSSLPEFVVSGISLPLALSPHSSTSFSVVFVPNGAQTYSGKIHITVINRETNVRTISVSGTGVAAASAPTYVLSPNASSVAFGSTLVGTSASQSVSVTNTGTGSVTISQVGVSSATFAVSGFSGAVSLAAGQSLALAVSFAPSAVGSATGSLTITSNATNSPATVALSGTGVQPQISVTPTSVNFGSVTMGTTNTQTLTISNPGTANLTVAQASMSGTGFTSSGMTMPLTVAAGSSSAFTVSFAPTAAGTFSGTLTLANNSPTASLAVPLSGTGAAQTLQLSASPSSLSFGSILTGSSTSQTVTLTNTGNGSVTLSKDSMTGTGFTVNGLTLPLTLSANQSTSFTVGFAPTAVGSVTGSVTVTSNATNSPATVALSGTGVQPQISVAPASVSFGSVTTGATNTQTLTISNPGTASLTVTQASMSGTGFSSSGLTMPLTIAPGASSSCTVSFAPTAPGTFSGSLTLANNSPTASLAVALSGTGVAQTLQLSASPTSLSFGSVLTGSSTTKTVTLTNSGTGSLTLSSDSLTGTGFAVTGLTLPLTLAANQSTSFTVGFDPTAVGSVTGSVTVTSNATNSPATITLSGTGVQPQISVTPASVSFGSVATGVTNTQTLTISNPGTASLTVTQASLSGTGFADSGLTLPLTVAAGGSSAFTVSFAPTAAGTFSGTLTLANNSPTASVTVALSGTGVAQVLQLSASSTSLSFGSVTTGTSATQTVTLSNTGNTNVTLSKDSVTGTGFSVSGLSLPLTLDAGQSTSFSVAFAPTATGSVTGSVTVTSNATNSPTTISLSGTGASAAYTVTLTWTPSSSSYSGFNVYRSTVSGGPYTKIDTSLIPTPTYTDSTVTAGQTYYYVATEVDTSGNESAYSTPTSTTIP